MLKTKYLILSSLMVVVGLTATISATLAQAPKPVNWTEIVTATPEGGYAIGNPKAPMVITEYGSYTCSHCADFAKLGTPKLMPYLASGKVRFEFRSYLRNSPDIIVSMITYCQVPARFFRMSDMMFARVQDWGKGFNTISPADQAAWKDKPLAQILPQVADKSGVTAFMQQRGLPVAATNACLNNQATLARLQAAQKVAYEKYKIQGTPAFLMNGNLLEGASGWETLEPRIKAGK
jgi:protein-disulfide isomerase